MELHILNFSWHTFFIPKKIFFKIHSFGVSLLIANLGLCFTGLDFKELTQLARLGRLGRGVVIYKQEFLL